jgi:hypothetical protein
MTGVEEKGLEMIRSVLSVYKLKNVNLRRRILEKIIKQVNNAEVTKRTSCLSAQLFHHFFIHKQRSRRKEGLLTRQHYICSVQDKLYVTMWRNIPQLPWCLFNYYSYCNATCRKNVLASQNQKLFLYPRPYRIFRNVFSLCGQELLAHRLTHQPQDCWLCATAYLTL